MLDTPFSLSRRGALKLTLILILAQLACGIPIGLAGGVMKTITGSMPDWVSSRHPAILSFINISATVIALRYALRQTSSRASELFVLRVPSPKVLAIVLLTLCGFAAVYSELNNVIQWLAPAPSWIRRSMGSQLDLSPYPWSTTFALVIMAPLTEELFCRGLLLRRLLASVPAWTAIWTSALLFMGMHINPWQFPIALSSGLLMGWIYARTRSLALCLFAHAFINGTVLLATGLPFQVRGFNVSHAPSEFVLQPWWFDLGGAAALATGLYLFTRTTPPLPPPPVRLEPPLLPIEMSPLPSAASDSALPTA